MMKRPRFSLRMLLVVVAILSLPLGFASYQLNWIRERHSFFQKEQPADAPIGALPSRGQSPQPPNAPWSLRLFSERGVKELWVFREDKERATRLFPEAKILIWKAPRVNPFQVNPYHDY